MLDVNVMDFDVIIYDTVGGPFSAKLEKERLLGGSELLLVQIAEALKARGHRVLAFCNSDMPRDDEYVGAKVWPSGRTLTCRTLLVSRYSLIPSFVKADRIVGVATDTAGDELKPYLVVASSDYQVDILRKQGFKNVTRIYNMLGPIPKVERVKGRFVFASGPMKGRSETITKWCTMKGRALIPKEAQLVLISPGWGDKPNDEQWAGANDISYAVPKNSADYRRMIAEAEGLFFVSSGLPETYGNVAAIAYRAGVKTHILCKSGFGGIHEATPSVLVTNDEKIFEYDLIKRYGELVEIPDNVPDHSPEALVGAWEEALGLETKAGVWRQPEAAPVRYHSGATFAGPRGAQEMVDVEGELIPAVLPVIQMIGRQTIVDRPFVRPEDLAPLQEVFDGEYDHAELGGFDKPRILDIGANVGAFTRWAQARWPGAKITAYEPDARHCELFRRNCPGVELIEAAVTCSPAPKLYAGAGNSGMSSLIAVDGLTREESVRVNPFRPKDLPQADILKVDTEGSELDILSGYAHLATVSAVLLEYHTAANRDAITKLLEGAGLTLLEHKVHSWGGGRAGIMKWHRASAWRAIFASHCLSRDCLRGSPAGDKATATNDPKTFRPNGCECTCAQCVSSRTVTVVLSKRAGSHLGHYVNTLLPEHLQSGQWGSAQRYWVHDRILVGGSILDEADAARLRDLGVTHVLSAEHERDDQGKWPDDRRARFAWPDSGGAIPEETIRNAIRFIRDVLGGPAGTRDMTTVLYVHCQMGGSRGPVLGYLALRSVFGLSPSEALSAIRTPWAGDNKKPNPAWAPHVMYLDSIERVLGEQQISVDLSADRPAPRADGRPTVGLVMISKGDEGATIIARAIVSALKVVDAVTVVADGGDQTVAVCRALGAEVHLRPTPPINWETGVGLFAAARNEALEIAEPRTDYVLMLDPDDWFEGELPTVLDKDIYELVVYDSGLRYPRPQLYRSSKHFRYTGIIHETVTGQGAFGRIESLRYIRGHGGHQDQQSAKEKFGRHARWLERWLFDHPEDTRAQFYLGQSYRDARDYDKAIVAYERRVEMGGWEEERAFAACQIARILRDTGKDPTVAYLRAWELRPSRAEPLVELATWLRDEKQKRFALAAMVARQAVLIPEPKGESLFLEPMTYQYRALEELAIALYWSGDKPGARKCYEELQTRTPEWIKSHMKTMLEMIVRELESKT